MPMPSISQWLKQRRLPRVCALCALYHTGADAVCAACLARLSPIAFSCVQCARPLPESQFRVCGVCIQNKPWFDTVIAPYAFDELLRILLHEFKYRQGLYLMSFLAELILSHLPPQALQTECLLPVPMDSKRLSERGFNQSAELAKFLGKQLRIPVSLSLCHKVVRTLPQAGLSALHRQKNLLNAFQIMPNHYQRVTIIDDLLTTGSTANELARVLKQQGVLQVDVWCCARVI